MTNGEIPYGNAYGYMPYMPTYTPSPEEAPHLGHSKHLCDMVKRGVDLELFKDLVRNPKFICKKCGRAAANDDNLCEPVSLEPKE